MKKNLIFNLTAVVVMQALLVVNVVSGTPSLSNSIATMACLSPRLNIEHAEQVFSQAATEKTIHAQRRVQLSEKIEGGQVVRIGRDGNGNYVSGAETIGEKPVSTAGEPTLQRQAGALLAELVLNIKVARERLEIVVNSAAEFRAYSAGEREKLVFIARFVDLLVVKDRYTLHENGPFAHARRGLYMQPHEDLSHSAIWLGALTVRDLLPDDLARVLLEEAQHILYPNAAHRHENNPDGKIAHSRIIFDRLSKFAEKNGEQPAQTQGEADMFGPSLILRQALTVTQKLFQKLTHTITLQVNIKHIYKTFERAIPIVWGRAQRNDRIFTFDWYGQKFNYAVINKDDYFDQPIFEERWKKIYGMAFYSGANNTLYILIDDCFIDDSCDEQYLDFVVVHEIGEFLFWDHHQATKLEFAYARERGKLLSYLRWLYDNIPTKFANVFSYLEGFDFPLPDDIKQKAAFKKKYKKIAGDLEHENPTVGYAKAAELIQNFSWEEDTEEMRFAMELFFAYDRIRKKATSIMARTFEDIALAMREQPEAAFHSFPDFMRTIDKIVEAGVSKLIRHKLAAKLDLAEFTVLCHELKRAFIKETIMKQWEYYKQLKKISLAKEVKIVQEVGKEKFSFIDADFDIDVHRIIACLEEARKKEIIVPGKKPGRLEKDDIVAMMIEECVADHQYVYLESSDLSDLKPYTYRDVRDDMEMKYGKKIPIKKIREIMGAKKIMIHEGREYPFALLVPDKDLDYILVRDILEQTCRDCNLTPEQLIDELTGKAGAHYTVFNLEDEFEKYHKANQKKTWGHNRDWFFYYAARGSIGVAALIQFYVRIQKNDFLRRESLLELRKKRKGKEVEITLKNEKKLRRYFQRFLQEKTAAGIIGGKALGDIKTAELILQAV